MSAARRVSETARIWWRQYRELGLGRVMLWICDSIVTQLAGAPVRRLSEITPHLHLGGQYSARGWRRLVDRGVTAVVNLRAEFDDRRAGIAPGRYLHLPTGDEAAPSEEHLRQGIGFISQESARGGSVYVHCHAGTGRAATLVAAYLVSIGLGADDAWEAIRERRPFVCPSAAQARQVALLPRGT